MRSLSLLAAILFVPASVALTGCDREEPAAPPPPPTTTIGANTSTPATERRVEIREVERPVVVERRVVVERPVVERSVVIEAPRPPTPPRVELHAPTPPRVEARVEVD